MGETNVPRRLEYHALVLTCNDTRYMVSGNAWEEMLLPFLVILATGRNSNDWRGVGAVPNK